MLLMAEWSYQMGSDGKAAGRFDCVMLQENRSGCAVDQATLPICDCVKGALSKVNILVILRSSCG
jgi:hypothetical protein